MILVLSLINRIRPSIIHVGRRCSYKEVYKALEENIIPDDLQDFMPCYGT